MDIQGEPPDGVALQPRIEGLRITLPGNFGHNASKWSAAAFSALFFLLLLTTALATAPRGSMNELLIIIVAALLIVTLTMFLPIQVIFMLARRYSSVIIDIGSSQLTYQHMAVKMRVPLSSIQQVWAPEEGPPRLLLAVDWSCDAIHAASVDHDKHIVWPLKDHAQATWLAQTIHVRLQGRGSLEDVPAGLKALKALKQPAAQKEPSSTL